MLSGSDQVVKPPGAGPDQPSFYPVLTLAYARKIARDWNAVGTEVGFVTEFEIDNALAARYPIQDAAGRSHQELWVPSEDLEEFNSHLIGAIRVVEAFPGPDFTGTIAPGPIYLQAST